MVPIGRRVAVGHVDGAVRKPDVIDDAGEFGRWNGFAHRGFDQVAQARGLFDASAGLGAKVQVELAGVGGGEEVAAEPGEQQKRGGAEREEHGNEDSTAANAGFERPQIAQAARFKTAFEGALESGGEVPRFAARRHDARGP